MSCNVLTHEPEEPIVEGAMASWIVNNFQPMEDIRHDAFNPRLCIPCALTGKPRPIFRYTTFPHKLRSTRRIYDEIQATLLLASHFLTSPACTWYWATLLYGDREYDAEMSGRLDRKAYRITELREYHPDDEKRLAPC